jgi:hypothetical protein
MKCSLQQNRTSPAFHPKARDKIVFDLAGLLAYFIAEPSRLDQTVVILQRN